MRNKPLLCHGEPVSYLRAGQAQGIQYISLKSRLEILLGAKTDAAMDESLKEEVEKEAEHLARKKKIAKAGGQLLGADFAFIDEMFPEKEEPEQTIQLSKTFKNGFPSVWIIRKSAVLR